MDWSLSCGKTYFKMKTYIALLRGINVGGHHKILMTDLRSLLTNLGFKNVTTYIQSGNIIFTSDELSIPILEDQIKAAIADRFGFKIPVVIKTNATLQSIFNDCPFSQIKKENSYFFILNREPQILDIEEASRISYPNDEFVITKKCIYLYCEKGYGRSKFNSSSFEKKLNVIATARNYKTMLKLLSLSSEIENQ